MRDIKFRWWCPDGEEMYYSDNLPKFFHNMIIDNSTVKLYVEGIDCCVTGVRQHKVDCDPMQYTGLKDKNGKEIYEGDIVKGSWIDCDDNKDSTFEVKYFPGGFSPFVENTGYASGLLYHTELFSKNFEIIGNIYENPEILEEK